MFAPAEAIIDPRNAEGEHRLFVTEVMEPRRASELGGLILDIFSEIGGREFGELEKHDKTAHLHAALTGDSFARRRVHTLALGIPRLRGAANRHGKLQVYAYNLYIPDDHFKAVRFGVYTNDSVDRVIPEASAELTKEFDAAIKHLADTEFADASLPIPSFHAGTNYNPTVFCP